MPQANQSRPHGTRQDESDQVSKAKHASEKVLPWFIEGATHSSIHNDATFPGLQPHLSSEQSPGIAPPLVALPVNLIRRRVQPFKQGPSSRAEQPMGRSSTLRFRASDGIVEWRIRIEPLSQGCCCCIGRGTHDRIWERFLDDGEQLGWRCLRVGCLELVQEGREPGGG